MKRAFAFAAGLLACASALPAAAQNIAMTGVTVVTGDGSDPIENGAVVVENGRVVYAGPAAGMPQTAMPPMEAEPGTWVTPGLVATVTNLGL
jgi:imidazolonepropionase-like amidohydrolase